MSTKINMHRIHTVKSQLLQNSDCKAALDKIGTIRGVRAYGDVLRRRREKHSVTSD